MSTLPKLETAEWIAERLGIPKHRVYELVRADAIPHTRLGRSVRFNPDRVAEWVDGGGTAGQPDRAP
jgi:excisionase family DNA binding protein